MGLLSQNQDISKAMFLPEALRKDLFSFSFQLNEAVCISCLVPLPSPCFYFQSQQWLTKSFSLHIPLTLILLPTSYTFKDCCNYVDFTRIIQINILFKGQLIGRLNFNYHLYSLLPY